MTEKSMMARAKRSRYDGKEIMGIMRNSPRHTLLPARRCAEVPSRCHQHATSACDIDILTAISGMCRCPTPPSFFRGPLSAVFFLVRKSELQGNIPSVPLHLCLYCKPLTFQLSSSTTPRIPHSPSPSLSSSPLRRYPSHSAPNVQKPAVSPVWASTQYLVEQTAVSQVVY
jgi:hypothetical protein